MMLMASIQPLKQCYKGSLKKCGASASKNFRGSQLPADKGKPVNFGKKYELPVPAKQSATQSQTQLQLSSPLQVPSVQKSLPEESV